MRTLLILTSLFLFGGAAFAGPIAGNDWSGIINGNCQFECLSDGNSFGDVVGAEDFSLGQSAVVSALSFDAWVRRSSDISGLTVDTYLFEDDGGLPGTVIAQELVTPTIANLGEINGTYDRVVFSMDITDILLAAGNYWVGFDVNLASGSFIVYWAETDNGSNLALRSLTSDLQNWITYGSANNYVFSVFDAEDVQRDIPAPAPLALLGIGLLGLGVSRRRRAA